MFTGIIDEVGRIAAIKKMAGRWELAIEAAFVPEGISEGDSISVDGVCLTATRISEGAFIADASLETLGVTTLRDRKTGDRVNLERAMRADSRFGGHIVMGHVDAIGEISGKEKAGDSIRLEVRIPKEISRYIVKKGSVAIDGISLTVNEQSDNRFTLNIIPYSASKTTLGSKNLGDQVNVETDILGRYVEKFVSAGEKTGTDLDFLYKHGYIRGK